MSVLTLRATLSGCSLARRSSVARKFLHLILAVSGVICWPMPPAPAPAADTAAGAGLLAAGAAAGARLMATGWVGRRTAGLLGGGAAAAAAAGLTTAGVVAAAVVCCCCGVGVTIFKCGRKRSRRT